MIIVVCEPCCKPVASAAPCVPHPIAFVSHCAVASVIPHPFAILSRLSVSFANDKKYSLRVLHGSAKKVHGTVCKDVCGKEGGST